MKVFSIKFVLSVEGDVGMEELASEVLGFLEGVGHQPAAMSIEGVLDNDAFEEAMKDVGVDLNEVKEGEPSN